MLCGSKLGHQSGCRSLGERKKEDPESGSFFRDGIFVGFVLVSSAATIEDGGEGYLPKLVHIQKKLQSAMGEILAGKLE
jgi:hypothetical protein